MSEKLEFGMVGLGVMGNAMSLNLADHGYSVAGLATSEDKAKAFTALGKSVKGFSDTKGFVESIRKPRPIMMLVPAGKPVDDVIAELKPLLEEDDLLIDGGNSYFKDTDRRAKDLESIKMGFFGMGVSGGQEGARYGPSMMPGGIERLWDRVKPILEKVSAKSEDGAPCVALMGPGSSGHYVKMVHNGIEYAIMEATAEIYDVYKRGLGKSNDEIGKIFASWDERELKSFLVEITADVLQYVDPKINKNLVDLISDKAKQKGTGKWTSQDAMDLGVPVPSIDISVSARELSGYQDERKQLSGIYKATAVNSIDLKVENLLHDALYMAMIISYTQGFSQLRIASADYSYDLKLEVVAKIWRAGCIIRSAFLQQIMDAFKKNNSLHNLLMDAEVSKTVLKLQGSLRSVVGYMAASGLPCPMLSASLAYFDAMRSEHLPTNLIQAQRDFFGAHTYERTDMPGVFHTQWTSKS